MLGKLIKYELQATSRWFLPIYILALLLASIEGVTVHMLDSGIASHLEAPWENIVAISFFAVSLAYVFSLIAASVASSLLIIYRFYKNLVTNEGYLMHTLPVTTSQLIWSKAIAGIMWTIVSAVIICIALVISTIGTVPWNSIISLLPKTISNFMEIYGADINIWLLFTELLLAIIIGSLYCIFTIYAAIAIGQLFHKHKVAFAFLAYYVIDLAIHFLSTIIAIPVFNSLEFSGYQDFMTMITNFFMPVVILGFTAITAILYFVTSYIFKNRLNLE